MTENIDKEKYEKDRTAHINYINEQYKAHNLELIRKEDLDKLNRKKYFSGFLTGFLIFLGILGLSGVILYLGFNNKFISAVDLVCGNQTNICEKTVCQECQVCGDCNPTFSCEVPDDININIRNDTI